VPRVGGDPAIGLFDRALDDVDADLLIAFELQAVEHFRRANQRDAAAGDDPSSTAALVACIASSTRASFPSFGLGGRTDLDDRTPPTSLASRSAASRGRSPTGGVLDLRADLLTRPWMASVFAAALHDRRVVLVES